MAIRFVDTPDDRSRKPARASDKLRAATGEDDSPAPASPDDAAPRPKSEAQAEGEARFATPIEAAAPVNPDASGELPFTDLPRAETSARKKRASGKAKAKDTGAA